MSQSDFSTSNQNPQKRSIREKKPNLKDDLGYVETKLKCKDAKQIEINKRCEKILSKLKKHQHIEIFLINSIPENPSLPEIERRVRNCHYTSIHMFAMEVRKVWKYFFSTGVNNPEQYQKTIDISQYFEEVFIEAEEASIEAPGQFETLTKKIQKIESKIQLNEKKQQQQQQPMIPMNNNYLQKQPSRTHIPLSEKPMTITEKNSLGNNIRQLNADQMKGIISILSDQYSLDQSSRFFEFDIDMLTTKKLRELEKYVKKCLKSIPRQSTMKSTTKVCQQFLNINYLIKIFIYIVRRYPS